MSIDVELQSAIDRGILTPLAMRLESDRQERAVLLSKEVFELVMGPYLTKQHEKRAGKLRADLENFVIGNRVVLCMTPRRRKSKADFGRLDPIGEAIWDYRSRDPSPALRLLGHWRAKNAFVALNWWPRSRKVDWSEKEPLADDLMWRIAMHDCQQKWFEALPNGIPLSAQTGDEYVSGKLHLI